MTSLVTLQTAEVNRLLTKLYRDLGVESAIVTLNEISSVPNPHSPYVVTLPRILKGQRA
jgi:hypothetical protein